MAVYLWGIDRLSSVIVEAIGILLFNGRKYFHFQRVGGYTYNF